MSILVGTIPTTTGLLLTSIWYIKILRDDKKSTLENVVDHTNFGAKFKSFVYLRQIQFALSDLLFICAGSLFLSYGSDKWNCRGDDCDIA